MAIVIQAFRERFHDMKLYKIDDDYPEEDADRVKYLVSQGFLSVKKPANEDSPTLNLENGGVLENPSSAIVGDGAPEAVKPDGEQESEKPKRSKKGVNENADSGA